MSEFVRRTSRQAAARNSRLGAIDIELTERCNNNCVHCCINRPANDPAARSGEMRTDAVLRLLGEAAALGCLQVRLTGGEPLLRKDFDEIYVGARRLGLKVLLFTNGCLITPRIAELFARIPPLAPIEVTVYGMSRQSYESVTRQPGSYDQFRRGIGLLLDNGISFVVKSVVLPQNRHEMAEFEQWAKSIPGMRGSPAYAMFLDLRNRRDEVSRSDEIRSLRLSAAEGAALLARDSADNRAKLRDFASRFMGPSGDALFSCGAGKGPCVDAYGRAQPCLSLRAPQLKVDVAVNAAAGTSSPSAADADVTAVAPGLGAALARFSALGELRAENPDYLRRCSRCALKGLCEQCPAKSWAEHGTLDTPVDYFCEAAHAQARQVGWLGENEWGWEVRDWRERLAGAPVGGVAADRHDINSTP